MKKHDYEREDKLIKVGYFRSQEQEDCKKRCQKRENISLIIDMTLMTISVLSVVVMIVSFILMGVFQSNFSIFLPFAVIAGITILLFTSGIAMEVVHQCTGDLPFSFAARLINNRDNKKIEDKFLEDHKEELSNDNSSPNNNTEITASSTSKQQYSYVQNKQPENDQNQI